MPAPGFRPQYQSLIDPNRIGSRQPLGYASAFPAGEVVGPRAGDLPSAGGSFARYFNASARIVMSLAAPIDEPATFAVICWPDELRSQVPVATANVTTFDRGLQMTGSASSAYSDGPTGNFGLQQSQKPTPTGSWQLLIASKTAATPGVIDASMYSWRDGTWAHAFGSTVARSTAVGTSIVIGASHTGGGSVAFRGMIAVAGVTGKTLSQAERESMVGSDLLSTLALWQTAGFDAANGGHIFVLDQDSTATAVTDAVGSETQTSTTGTAVVPIPGGVPFITATTADVTLTPGAANADAAGSTPSVDMDQGVSPAAAAATASGSTPSIVVDAAMTPGQADATASGSTPLIDVSGDITVVPNPATATAAGSTATIQTDSALTPGQATATASGSTPTLSVDAVRVPGPAVATASGSTAGVTTDAVVDVTITPGAAAATATGSTATIVITPDPVIPPAPGGGGGDVDFGDETSIYGASVRLEPGPAVAWASGSFAEVVVVNAPRPFRIILPKRRRRPLTPLTPLPKPVVNQRVHAGTARAVASGSAARVEALSVLSQAEIEDLRGESEEDAVALLMLTS